MGLRIPNNQFVLLLIRLSVDLLVESSANRTGEESLRAVQEISEELKGRVDVILDGGAAAQGIPSTVVDLSLEKPRILREGSISLKMLLDALAFGA